MTLIVIVNVRLIMPAYQSSTQPLLKQLRSLKSSLDNHADEKMQNIYPEGYLFFNALYSLAWSNCLVDVNENSSLYAEGHREIQRAVNKMNTTRARHTFEADLSISFGAFYKGWSLYSLAKKLSIENSTCRSEQEVKYFKQQCDSIAQIITEKIYPVSYTAKAWPADVMVCVAALSQHDQIFEAKYRSVIQQWISKVKRHLDTNGMIPHEVNPNNGRSVEDARGSSQSLMLIFLNEIDPTFGKEIFKSYKQKFPDTNLGLTGIREYPKGRYGSGDVDSGPIFLQIGASATLVGFATLNVYGESQTAAIIDREINAFGLAIESDKEKKYLFGYLPLADAFVAWTHSLKPSSDNIKIQFKLFHLYSAMILLLGIFIIWLLLRKEKQKFLYILW